MYDSLVQNAKAADIKAADIKAADIKVVANERYQDQIPR